MVSPQPENLDDFSHFSVGWESEFVVTQRPSALVGVSKPRTMGTAQPKGPEDYAVYPFVSVDRGAESSFAAREILRDAHHETISAARHRGMGNRSG